MSGTAETPLAVAAACAFLTSQEIWHRVTRNPPVHSCADAAAHRRRLGNTGIPLCDELKSSAGLALVGGVETIVIVHCRGHQQLDFMKVSQVLGAPFRRLSTEELRGRLDMEYGTVSPFVAGSRPDVLQVIDDTVCRDFYPPYTMMTNLGDLRYAVEFRPGDLFAVLPRAQVADVVKDTDSRVPVRQVIGILTGNSPESGMLLWQAVNDEVRRDPRVRVRGDIDFPQVIIDSTPEMGLSMELQAREDAVRPTVLGGVKRLCTAGANVIAIACNTTQFYADDVRRVCAPFGAQFLSLVDTTADHLRKSGVHAFDLLGIGPVTDLAHWSGFGQLKDEFSISVPSDHQIQAMTDLAFSVKREVVSTGSINRLRDLVASSTENETVVLALTELSILFASQRGRSRSGKVFVDTLQLLGKEIARRYCDERVAVGAN